MNGKILGLLAAACLLGFMPGVSAHTEVCVPPTGTSLPYCVEGPGAEEEVLPGSGIHNPHFVLCIYAEDGGYRVAFDYEYEALESCYPAQA